MNQVGNVLAKDNRFEKVGFDDGIDIWGFEPSLYMGLPLHEQINSRISCFCPMHER